MSKTPPPFFQLVPVSKTRFLGLCPCLRPPSVYIETAPPPQGYQPSGFLNPLTLPEAKGYPYSGFPNLYGMVTHMGILNPPGFTPGNFQSMCTTRSPDQHRHSTTTVTMASHTGISVFATFGVVISSLVYTQNYQASAPLRNKVHLNRIVPQGVQLSHTHGANDIPLELPLKRVFPGNIPTGLTKFILLQKRSRT